MGDINFNIAKDVNLNKVVNLDIDKNVDVNVNVDALLATAEADAEAFGEFGLAEVDAYTYVNEGTPTTQESPGQVDAVGNAEVSLSIDDGNNTIDVGDQITVNHEDVDDIDGFDHFADLSSPPPDTPDVPLPDDLLGIDNKVIDITGEVDGVDNLFTGVLTDDVVIDFGERTLSTLQDPGPYPLTVTIAAGTEYLVDQLLDGNGDPIPGDFEVDFNGTPDDITVEFAGSTTIIEIEELAYTQEAAGIGAVGEWNFDVLVNIIEDHSGDNGGEAFAYAESTSAVDLP
ncbi:MAG: hypothetical protein AB4368_05710 [Xenococcaceae cyanobacterium]